MSHKTCFLTLRPVLEGIEAGQPRPAAELAHPAVLQPPGRGLVQVARQVLAALPDLQPALQQYYIILG